MTRRLLAALVLATLTWGCLPRATREPDPRLFQCHRARGNITIDGKIDEPAWQAAQVLDDFRLPISLERPQSASSVRVLWDDECLYFAMVMEDLDVYGMKTEHDTRTWEDDVAELFVKPSAADHPYYEIHVNPRNTKLDLFFPRRGAGTFDRFTPWSSGMRSAVIVKGTLNNWRDKDKGWLVEAAIPLKAFAATTPKPQLGDRWRFAFCRYDYSVHLENGRELSSTALLTKASFHTFEAYDDMEFAE